MQQTNFFRGLLWGLSLSLFMWAGIYIAVDSVVQSNTDNLVLEQIELEDKMSTLASKEMNN